MKATRDLLIQKNKQYGNSALNPIGIFGDSDAIKSLGARMDDKLMRLRGLDMDAGAIDTLYDLTGYLCLLVIAIERQEQIDSTEHVVKDDSNTGDTLISVSKTDATYE
jgi:hypothetical protein